MWEPPAARKDIRYRGWRTKLCTRVGRAETRLHISVVWMTISWDAYEINMRSYTIDHHRQLWYQSSFQSSNNDHSWAGPAEFTRNWECSSASGLGSIVSMTGYWDAYKWDIPMRWRWWWWWWAASGSHHRCRRVKTRLILWLEISPRLQYLIPTMTYTWQELQVWDWMVVCRTFRLWTYGGRCHFGCSFFLFSSLYLFTCLLLWISAWYKWRRHWFLPPLETSQVRVESPRAPNPPNGYHIVLIHCGTYGIVHLCTLNSCLVVSFLLLYGFMQPRGSTHKEGDNVTARLHVMYPGPDNTSFIYSGLATSLRSLAIILLSVPYTTLHYWHPRLHPYLLIYLPTRPYTGVCLYNKAEYGVGCAAIKKFDISEAAIHSVHIYIYEARLGSTDKYGCWSPNSCWSTLHRLC